MLNQDLQIKLTNVLEDKTEIETETDSFLGDSEYEAA